MRRTVDEATPAEPRPAALARGAQDGLTASPASDRLARVGQRAGNRALARLLNPPRPSHGEAELVRFRTTLFAPRRNFEPSSGKGRFDVQLLPLTGLMLVTVRVRFHFLSGRTKDDDEFPGVQGTTASEFEWQPGEQQRYRERFLTEIAPQWSGKFSFVSTRTPQDVWQDVTITPVVRIVEDDADPHVVLDIHKRPDDAESVTNFVRPRDPAQPGKPLETYFTSDFLRPDAELDDPVADPTVPITKVHFRRGSSTLDDRGAAELAPIVARMTGDPTSHAYLRGHASSDRRAGTSAQQGFRDNLQLSRARSRAVADALEAAGIAPERLLIRNWGDSGATFDDDHCRVDVAVGSHQTRQGAAHEFGHILGLGDEYGYADLPGARPGDPLRDEAYVKMVKEQAGVDLVRTSDESMMSKGGTIRRWHYSPFLEALKAIDGPQWKLP